MYKNQINNFLNTFAKNREFLQMDNTLTNIKKIEIDGKLMDNEKIVSAILDVLTSTSNEENNRKVLFAAPTGRGKTYLILNLYNQLNDYIKEEMKGFEGFVVRRYINILLTPKKIQNQNNEHEYENVKSITSGDSIEESDLINYNSFSIVYDKIDESLNILEDLIEKLGDEVYYNICIDEAHQLISSVNYRRNCLLSLDKAINKLNNANIIYMTATFNPCCCLDFNEFIAAIPTYDYEVEKITQIQLDEDTKTKDAIFNALVYIIKQGKIPCIRLNNKKYNENTKENFENLERIFEEVAQEMGKKGFKIGTLSSSNKENNEIYNEIMTKGTLKTGYDGYIFTSILDEGTSIKSMSDGSKPKNLSTVFIIDNKNANIDNYIQFNKRFRWDFDESFCIVCKHESKVEEMRSLSEILEEQSMIYNSYYDTFKSYEKAKRLESELIFRGESEENSRKRSVFVKKELEKILELEDFLGNKNHKNVFFIDNNNIVFDKKAFFNKVYEEYMLQYFYYDNVRKHYLQEVFDCKVETLNYSEVDCNIEIIDYTKEHLKEFFESVRNNKEVEAGEDVKNTKEYELYSNIIDYKLDKEDLNLVLDNFIDNNTKDNKTLLQQLNKKDIEEFNSQKLLIDVLKGEEVGEVEGEDKERVQRIVKSDYIEFVNNAIAAGLTYKDAIDKIKKINTFDDCLYYVKELEAIKKNKEFKKNKKKFFESYPGSVGKEYITLIELITNIKQDKKKITINDIDFILLAERMSNKTKNKYNKKQMMNLIKLYFVVEEQVYFDKTQGKNRIRFILTNLKSKPSNFNK
jgi:hypothetical protein